MNPDGANGSAGAEHGGGPDGAGAGTFGPDSLVFKSDRPWPNPRLRVGAIIGHATPAFVRMWLRTGSPGRFTLLLYDCAEAVGSAAVRASLRARLGVAPFSVEEAGEVLRASRSVAFEVPDYASDTTHVLDISGLDPDTRYGYALHAEAAGLFNQVRMPDAPVPNAPGSRPGRRAGRARDSPRLRQSIRRRDRSAPVPVRRPAPVSPDSGFRYSRLETQTARPTTRTSPAGRS